MKYLVLYKVKMLTGAAYHERRSNDYTWSQLATWEEFTDKQEAIECARQNKGAIVEAFEFDIVKGGKK